MAKPLQEIGITLFNTIMGLDLRPAQYIVRFHKVLLGWWYGVDVWPIAPHELIDNADLRASQYVNDKKLTEYGRDAMREVRKALRGE
jgi:hypothetical protein